MSHAVPLYALPVCRALSLLSISISFQLSHFSEIHHLHLITSIASHHTARMPETIDDILRSQAYASFPWLCGSPHESRIKHTPPDWRTILLACFLFIALFVAIFAAHWVWRGWMVRRIEKRVERERGIYEREKLLGKLGEKEEC